MNVTKALLQPIFFFFYGSTAIVGLGRFSSSLIYTQSVGLIGRGISPSQGRYLYTQDNTNTG
jgi:hypothetical protein